MGVDRNRARAQRVVEQVLEGELESFDDGRLSSLSNKMVGSIGEEFAAHYLTDRGYEIIDRNYRCCEGEADLVAFDPDSDEVVLIEVKTRRGEERSLDRYPEEAVTPAKQRRYRRIALQFAAEHYPVPSVRFDVIAVTLVPSALGKLRHLYGAFDWEAQ
ncbi:MAG: YraN family protein [Coriobacteriaceae bacterium]|nr:YraN family protein [Coriobacteriaceae bacterium]